LNKRISSFRIWNLWLWVF